jgi:penicillin-binding protein 1A
MALPIWAIFMQKLYDDPELGYSKGDFEPPLKELSVEIDCDKYNTESGVFEEVEDDIIEF